MKSHLKLICLFLARTGGLFRVSRWLTRHDLRLLCYHGGRIGDENEFNPKLFLSTEIFRARMQWLKDNKFNLISLDQALAVSAASPPAPLRTAVTFDDGWYSTTSELLPVMAEFNFASTLYLCTSHFLEGSPVLAVTVRYILWKSGLSRCTLSGFHSELDGHHELSTEALKDRLADSIVAAINRACAENNESAKWLERFAEQLGVPAADLNLGTRRFSYASAAELRVAAHSGCSIELHGHIHDYPLGNPPKLLADLTTCAQVIMAAGLPAPKHYCYPSGRFDKGASTVLEGLNVISATTCVPGFIRDIDADQRYYLPRFLDGENIPELVFQAEMSGFLELLRRVFRGVGRRKSPITINSNSLPI
jgi:peptidoglycan/xylan/chitin deacetylase (PgdA/CDA1 family)